MRGWKQWNGAERTALIAAGLGIVGSLFMPWATVLGASLYGFEGDGIITAILFAVALLPNARWGWWLVLVAGALASFIAFNTMANLSAVGLGGVGVGLMVVLAAGVVLAVASVVAWRTTRGAMEGRRDAGRIRPAPPLTPP